MIVVMKFHSSQNLNKNTKLTANKAIRAKLRTNPTPSDGRSLKFALRWPNIPYNKTRVKIPIRMTINMVNAAGGSTLCSGGFVRMMFGGL